MVYATMLMLMQVVDLLLSQGAAGDVNSAAALGFTPLLRAAEGGHTRIVKTLLHKGASIDSKTSQGNTALLLACSKGHADTAACLVAEAGAQLLEKANAQGFTPLLMACQYGHAALAEALVQQGAVTSARTDRGFTALMLACQHGQLKVSSVLEC
jgi:ankyrin repeat protein